MSEMLKVASFSELQDRKPAYALRVKLTWWSFATTTTCQCYTDVVCIERL